MAKAHQIKGIECDGDAATGIRLVLSGRFEEMSNLRGTALNWKDPEGVHSMRVASRRLRSALRDFMPYLRGRGLAPSLDQIRNIARALGAVRDQDVAILALEKLQSQAPAEVSAVLRQLIDARNEVRQKARQELKQHLGKNQLKQLSSRFATAVDLATANSKQKGKQASRSSITYLKMSRSIITDRLRDLEKLSNSLYLPLEVEPLHEMRIAAKRLRYAIELFKGCWGQDIVPFANDVARLQLSLGELHDCDVWIESFGNHIINSKKKKQSDQSDAFAWLLSHFIKVRNKHLSDAFLRWREWEVNDSSAKLREKLKTGLTIKTSRILQQ